MAVDSASVSKRSVSGKKERMKSPLKKESNPQENLIPSSPAKRNKSPGIRVVGGRIYDSVNGKTCHQCRQKTRDFTAACKNQRNDKPCPILYCHKCLLNRYGEKAEEVAVSDKWSCPKCRGICNCSVCMKKRGQKPTGILINAAKATGFSSVSEMLLKGSECLSPKNVGSTVVLPKKEVVLSPRKRGKENSFDGKVDANLPNHVDKKSKKVRGNIDDKTSMKILSKSPEKQKTKQEDVDINDCNKKLGVSPKGTGSHVSEDKPKKNKRAKLDEMSSRKNDEEILKKSSGCTDEKKPKKAKKNESEENGKIKKNDASLARRTSPRKLKGCNNMPKQGGNLDIGVGSETNTDNRIAVKKKVVKSLENDKQKAESSNGAKDKNIWKLQNTDIGVDIPLPLGRELNSVAGIDLRAEDAGNALQFLEFCSVFGKILDVKKGQPEHVLQDLLHGRIGRRGKFSLTVQFHIHVLSILLKEQGEECTNLSPSYGKSSWFDALKKCLSESQGILKAQRLDTLENAADYESFSASEKLRLLNILCDEVLSTEKVRNWMDDQNTELAEKIKEAKQKVTAAKDKEKNLKQKIKDDIAKAIIAKHGAGLSISEHEAIVSRIKHKAAQAHAEVLESQGTFYKNNQTSDAVRTEPIFIGSDGHTYWKLKCFGKSNLLHQDVGKGDSLTLDEKWFAIEDEGKETIEKHISSLRIKRLKAPKIRDNSNLN